MSKSATVPSPLEYRTASGLKTGDRVRYGGTALLVAKSQVVKVDRTPDGVVLRDSKGHQVALLSRSAKVWLGSTSVAVLPGRTSPAPKPSPTVKAKAAPKPKVNTKGTVTSPTGLSVEELSERARKAAATRKARELDPGYVSPSSRPQLSADHPHRVRAAKAAATRQAIKAGTYTRPIAPNAGDRNGAARQAWATRRARQAATAATSTSKAATRTRKATATRKTA